ncbi:MAG: RES family NAD+ phosphorylase [Verrucomicrobia bacterium]|nr:RES family NAD+ phosphorylase [Verrucomicrobiota bacterium]
MKIKPNPRYEAFLAQLKTLKRPFFGWEGTAFRATPLPHAIAVRLLDGKGSLKTGGRWSAAGTFPAVNLSTSQETAVKESSASFTSYNLAPSDVRPKVLVGVRLRLAEGWRKVNDTGHEAQSQALGHAGHDILEEGVLAPSARVPGGINIVCFHESLASPSQMEILGEEELRRWLKKR